MSFPSSRTSSRRARAVFVAGRVWGICRCSPRMLTVYSGPTLQTAELYFSSPFPSFQSFLFSTNDDPLHYTENGCLGKLDEWEGPVRSCSRRGWIAACSAVPIVFWALKRCTNRYSKKVIPAIGGPADSLLRHSHPLDASTVCHKVTHGCPRVESCTDA